MTTDTAKKLANGKLDNLSDKKMQDLLIFIDLFTSQMVEKIMDKEFEVSHEIESSNNIKSFIFKTGS